MTEQIYIVITRQLTGPNKGALGCLRKVHTDPDSALAMAKQAAIDFKVAAQVYGVPNMPPESPDEGKTLEMA